MTAAALTLGVHAPGALVAMGDDGPRHAAQLWSDAGAISAALTSFAPGDEVAVLCHDRYCFAAALLAAIDRGLVVALPPNAQPETLKALRGGTVRTVLSDHDGTPGIDVRPLLGGSSAPITPPVLEPSRPFVVVYTSGSTGTPLACQKTAGQLLTEAAVLARTFDIGPRDAIVATVPPHHIYGLLFSVLVPLVSGAAFCRETPFYADVVRRVVLRDRASVLVSVPAHLRALSMMEREGTTQLRVFSSGAALPDETREMLHERFGWAPTEILGSSETGGIGWRSEAGAPFTAFDVVDFGVGEDDRLTVRSPYLPADAPQPFVTGDRIERVSERTFRHLGRADGVLKVGGTRVSLAELEQRLCAIAGVREAAVIAVEARGGRGQETWAVIARDGAEPSAEQVRAALRAWLDPVVIPRRYRFVDALPRESTGKLKKDVLRGLFDEEER